MIREGAIGMYSKYSKSAIFDMFMKTLAELEELQNRNCESCKHGKHGIDSNGREVECKLLWRCSRGYYDRYERKEDDIT